MRVRSIRWKFTGDLRHREDTYSEVLKRGGSFIDLTEDDWERANATWIISWPRKLDILRERGRELFRAFNHPDSPVRKFADARRRLG